MNVQVELVLKGAERLYKRVGPDVAEIFSQPRVAAEATAKTYGKRRITPGRSLDLTMNDPLDGRPWNLSKADKKERLFELMDTTRPYVIIGSPPCTAFPALQYLNESRRNPEDIARELRQAREHVRTCCLVYERQYHNN